MIKDSYGRPVDNLRLSVTQRCNLRCFYCHKEGELNHTNMEMTSEEIERVVTIAASLDIFKVKLTGGEPLLRIDIVEIVNKLRHISRIKEVAMTTNGILLSSLAKPLKAAGLARVNVSLGTLNQDSFITMTGVDAIHQVLQGINEATKVGLSPVKVNMIILKGLNDDQIQSMIDYTGENELVLQIIEFESPTPESANYRRYHLDLTEIERKLREKANKIIVRRMQKRMKYLLKGGGEVEIVRPMHNTSFCGNCSRLRITSDGKFKPCLFRNNHIDFLTSMRKGATDTDIKVLLLEAIRNRKPYFM